MSKKDKAAKAEKKSAAAAVPTQVPPTAPKARLEERQFTLISKALADPTRMAVLRAIATGGATCGTIKTCAGISAATLSHHMKELETAGLIETERKGRFLSAALHRKVWKSYLGELKSIGN